MNAIPSEILDGVIHYLIKPDIASLRLVCRGFSSFGTAILYETVHVFLLKESFERLASISQHDIYRHHVRGLVFYAPFLDQYRAIHGGYLKTITLTGGLRNYGVATVLDNETVAKGLEAYQQYHKEQAMLQSNGEAYAKLATAMSRLDKLGNVGIGYLRDCMGSTWKTDLLDYPVLLRQIAIETLMPAQEWYWECAPSDHLMTLLRAVSVSNLRLEHFRFDDPGLHGSQYEGGWQSGKDRLRDGDLDHLTQAFRHLKHLSVTLRHSSPAWKLAKATDNFAQFLIRCPVLEILSFNMQTVDEDGDTPLRTLSFPRLQHLRLGLMNIAGQELIKFFENLPNLRVLRLSGLGLKTGDWDEVFESLRDKGTVRVMGVNHLWQRTGGQDDEEEWTVARETDEVNQLITAYVAGKTKSLNLPPRKEVEEENQYHLAGPRAYYQTAASILLGEFIIGEVVNGYSLGHLSSGHL